jgi:hypothetical protein
VTHHLRYRVFLILFSLAALHPAAAEPTLSSGWKMIEAEKVAEAGERLSTTGYTPSGWYDATVPGTVLTTLVNEGVYPEPFFGTNLKAIPDDLCRKQWWYRVAFDLPSEHQGRHIWLNFDGINYRADIFLNGRLVGNMRGAFKRGIFDITAGARFGVLNALAVKIYPNDNPARPQYRPWRPAVAPVELRKSAVTGRPSFARLAGTGFQAFPTATRESGRRSGCARPGP